MRPRLIIFDCDGVLIDSEVIACRLAAASFTQAGYAISTEELAARFAGLSSRTMREQIEQELGRALPEDFGHGAQQELEDAFRAELRATRGIEVALEKLHVPVCVASSSAPARLRFTLELVGLYERFAPNVFSAVSVPRGKPAPDLFLHAAREMRTEPGACLVIEDSAPGVQAARAAGMPVLGFCGGGHCGAGHASRLLAEGAIAIFADMAKLPCLIA